jgi:transposase InsO family protein
VAHCPGITRGAPAIHHSLARTDRASTGSLKSKPFNEGETRLHKIIDTIAPRPRIISDNGPQFIANDFKEFIRISDMTHVRTAPSYPQSNGKLERWHKSIKSECIRPGVALSVDDAQHLITQYVQFYNEQRLDSAVGYVTPSDMLAGRREEIHAARDHKLEQARQRREAVIRTKSTSGFQETAA